MIIAEAGVNHNGDVELALRLCDAAKEAGADVVKFQTWITDRLITRQVAQAKYQTSNLGVKQSQYNMLKELELSQNDFRRIKEYCDQIGIIFASTADEPDSLDFLVSIGIPFIKVGSGEIGNIPYLRYIGSKKLPVILSTGMSSISDVDMSIRALTEGGVHDIILLHCTTSYPCAVSDVNLRAMLTLQDAFHYPIGYSDHTVGIEAAVAAVSLGAKVVEKHFTLDCNMNGPDHVASTEPVEFAKMVTAIHNVERMMGDGIKRPTIAEQNISKVVKKRIVASRKIQKGEVFSEHNICVKRNDAGLPAMYWDMIIGNISNNNYDVDEGIELMQNPEDNIDGGLQAI